MADMKDDNGTNKTLSAAARRSFFRRRLKHKRSGSKDGKDLMALDAISTDSLPITEGEKSSTEAALTSNNGGFFFLSKIKIVIKVKFSFAVG